MRRVSQLVCGCYLCAQQTLIDAHTSTEQDHGPGCNTDEAIALVPLCYHKHIHDYIHAPCERALMQPLGTSKIPLSKHARFHLRQHVNNGLGKRRNTCGDAVLKRGLGLEVRTLSTSGSRAEELAWST